MGLVLKLLTASKMNKLTNYLKALTGGSGGASSENLKEVGAGGFDVTFQFKSIPN